MQSAGFDGAPTSTMNPPAIPQRTTLVSQTLTLLERGVLSEGRHHYRTNPTARLEKLVQSHPNSAGVLFTSTPTMQAWFSARGLPVIRVGPVFSGHSVCKRILHQRQSGPNRGLA
jgi:hypothetical protein